MNKRMKKGRLVLLDIFATLITIVMPFIDLNTFFLFVLKVLFGLMIVLLIGEHRSMTNYILSSVVFFSLTFMLGGACFGILYMFDINTSINGLIIGGFEIPMGLFILLISIYMYIMYAFIKTLKVKDRVDKHTYDLTIYNGETKVYAKGLLDSGNLLIDENGNGISLISQKVFIKLFGADYYMKLVLNSITKNDIPSSYYMNINSVVSERQLLVVGIDRVQISVSNMVTTKYDIQAGVVLNNLGGDFDCILSPKIIKG